MLLELNVVELANLYYILINIKIFIIQIQEVEREAQILQKIKMKMDRIKATQQRVLEENEPKHHAAGKLNDSCPTGYFYFFSPSLIFLSFKVNCEIMFDF